jgi:hypothetical protein
LHWLALAAQCLFFSGLHHLGNQISLRSWHLLQVVGHVSSGLSKLGGELVVPSVKRVIGYLTDHQLEPFCCIVPASV